MRAKKTETSLRREQIAAAALDLIGDCGVSALSMAGIAERVGIVPSALYRHFSGKDEVLDAVLGLIRQRLLNNVDQVRRNTEGALPRLEAILMRHARMLSENRAIPHVIFADGIYTGSSGRKARVAEIMTGYLAEIQEEVKAGKREGTIRDDVVPETAAVMFLGVVLPAVVLWNVSAGNFDMTAHVKKAWPVFRRCIARE